MPENCNFKCSTMFNHLFLPNHLNIYIYIYIYPAPKVLDPVPAFLQHLVLLDDTDLLLRGHRLGSRLHDVELAIVAITGPLDVLWDTLGEIQLAKVGG